MSLFVRLIGGYVENRRKEPDLTLGPFKTVRWNGGLHGIDAAGGDRLLCWKSDDFGGVVRRDGACWLYFAQFEVTDGPHERVGEAADGAGSSAAA